MTDYGKYAMTSWILTCVCMRNRYLNQDMYKINVFQTPQRLFHHLKNCLLPLLLSPDDRTFKALKKFSWDSYRVCIRHRDEKSCKDLWVIQVKNKLLSRHPELFRYSIRCRKSSFLCAPGHYQSCWLNAQQTISVNNVWKHILHWSLFYMWKNGKIILKHNHRTKPVSA